MLLAAEAAFPPEAVPRERLERVEQALYPKGDRRDQVPSRLHQGVAELVAQIRQRDEDHQAEVFTTNYDDLLEQALRDWGVYCKPRYRWHNPRLPRDLVVHHIHGYLGAEETSDDVVVGSLDYDRVARVGLDWPGEELGTALARGPMLFVGTSLTDPNLLRILGKLRDRHESVRPDEGDAGYGHHVLLLAWQGLGFDRRSEPREEAARRLRLGHLLENLWRRYHVEVVLLDDFSDITLFLREVASAGPSYRPDPKARVQRLYDRVMRDFRELQEQFHRLLQDDLQAYLVDLIGSDATLTLWLCDGEGSAVLFGSSSRVHPRSEDLYRRLDNHRDDWVTQEAMASEGVKVKAPREETGRAEETRWATVGAAPLQPVLEQGPPVTAGALSFGTTKPWNAQDKNFADAGSRPGTGVGRGMGRAAGAVLARVRSWSRDRVTGRGDKP